MELQKSNGHIWKGVAAGLVGGLVATWAMGHFQGAWSDASDIATPSKRESHNGSQEKEDDPTMKSAEAISESVFGHSLAKKQKEKAGPLVHYAFGTLMGGVYGLAAEVSPTVKSVGGLPFGAALFLCADETALPVLNLTKGPSAYPPSRHLFGLSSHFVWAATTDLVRRIVLRVI